MKTTAELNYLIGTTEQALNETTEKVNKLRERLKNPNLHTDGFIKLTSELTEAETLKKALKNRLLSLKGNLAQTQKGVTELEEKRADALERYNKAIEPLKKLIDEVIETVKGIDVSLGAEELSEYSQHDYDWHKKTELLPQKEAKSPQTLANMMLSEIESILESKGIRRNPTYRELKAMVTGGTVSLENLQETIEEKDKEISRVKNDVLQRILN